MFKSLKEKLGKFLNIGSSTEKTEKTKEVIKEKKTKKPDKPKEKIISKTKTPQQKKSEEIVKEKLEVLEKKNEEEIDYAIDKLEEINEETISEIKEPEQKSFFEKLSSKFTTVKLTQEDFDEFFIQLETLMLENNIALQVIDKIREDLEKQLVNIEVKKGNIEKEIKETLRKSIEEILIEPFDLIERIREKDGVFVILFFGINGSGKTTTIAKIANILNENKIPSVLAAGDTFRAASIEQLKKHSEKLGVKLISQQYGSDPAAVAFDAISYAKSHGIKVVLIDTAGRMYTKDNLLKEMEKIIRVTNPDIKIFVAESITGNDATEQAKTFDEHFKIDGTILTKADVDEKGGTAISIGYVTKKPILFLGVGQEYKDIHKFSKKEIITNLGLD